MQSDSREHRYAQAEELLGQWLVEHESNTGSSFDTLIEAHADIAAELRELGAQLGVVGAAMSDGRADVEAERTAIERLLADVAGSADFASRYAIEGEVGKGGMGAVFRVLDRKLGRQLAMKVILGQTEASRTGKTPGVSPHQLQRFLNEARITSQLEHPGIVPVHEVGVDADGRAYFTMKLVKGRTLADALELQARGDPEWSRVRVLQLIQRVCEALAYAHEKGVVHRDLKPANVMVGDFGEVYVMDWGLARRFGEGDAVAAREVQQESFAPTLTREGAIMGTPAYMPPEQAVGRLAEVGPHSDVYAIGAMLYQSIAGHAPYCGPGEDSTGGEVLRRIVAGPPQRLGSRQAPPELLAVCERAMAQDWRQRYQRVGELAAELRAFLEGRVVKAYATGAWAEAKQWVRRNRALSSAGAVAALALALGILGTSVGFSQAQAKVHEFDQLAGSVLYDRAIAAEKDLYPAWPSKIEAMERWLREDAGKLLAMQPDIARTVRDLEARALPRTAEQIDEDRRSHARFGDFELARKRVASLRYAQAIRDGKPLVLPDLSTEQSALDVSALNSMAWERVAPEPAERIVPGEEALGLACARAAVDRAKGTAWEYQVQRTLAWASLASGQDAAGQQASERAWKLAPEAEAAAFEGHAHVVEAAITNASDILAAAEQELAALTTVVSERRRYRFELESQRFLHDALVDLRERLDSFANKEKAEVEKRLAWARQIQQLTLAHPQARHGWVEVRAAIASNPKYAGSSIEMRDQDITGLVPIGENPVTHLWEFYELRSAWDGTSDPREIVIPEHGHDGSVEVGDITGVVLVLLPGGTFMMGAQSHDEHEPNYDAFADPQEGPPHAVALTPFFLAKYELTQGQWLRLTGEPNPSYYKAGLSIGDRFVTLSNPVERVGWLECDMCLARIGLVLPTEAQWEYGCRAGTCTPWWSGSERESLRTPRLVANLADQTAGRMGGKWAAIAEWPELDDGWTVHAPVGRFAGNPFGLYDMHGNVWEYCRDGYGSYLAPHRRGDGLRQVRDATERVSRGGSYSGGARVARSSYRANDLPSALSGTHGLRAARLVRP